MAGRCVGGDLGWSRNLGRWREYWRRQRVEPDVRQFVTAGSGHDARGERREAISLDDELGASAKIFRRQLDEEREPAVRVALAGEDGAVVHL